jgi:hypothetical protein
VRRTWPLKQQERRRDQMPQGDGHTRREKQRQDTCRLASKEITM